MTTELATLREVGFDDPRVEAFMPAIADEYLTRYGDGELTAYPPAQFTPPHGCFLLVEVGGEPVGCGGYRPIAEDVAELKRMFIAPAHRRRGLARRLLEELEARARAAGYRRLHLETGRRQPEALALYRLAGYTPVPAFGEYADAPLAVHLGKEL